MTLLLFALSGIVMILFSGWLTYFMLNTFRNIGNKGAVNAHPQQGEHND